ncbi:MAG: M28 family peptidase [archaeon]|nr:M28 family peptidase [archaeon]
MLFEEYKKIEAETKKSLMKNMRDISFPRLVGTEGEKRAIEVVKQKYKEVGYDVITEDVITSYLKINGLQSAAMVGGGVILLIAAIVFMFNPLYFLAPLFLIFILLANITAGDPASFQPPFKLAKNIKTYKTENIIAQGPQKEGNINIIFMGHWDSKSTRLTGTQRLIAMVIFLFSTLGLALTGFIGIIFNFLSFDLTLITVILWTCSIVGLFSCIILAFNVVGNLSPGSCDNATSVANVIECMKYFKENPIDNVNFTYLLTTAEEVGLTGAVTFVKNIINDPKWAKDKTFTINWDIAGLDGPMKANYAMGFPKKVQCCDTMLPLVSEISEEQGFDFKPFYLPIGGWTDALVFNTFGYEAFTISHLASLNTIHSTRDAPNIIHEDSFFNSWIAGVEIAKKLSKI